MKKNNKININEALLRKLIQERLKTHLDEELLEEGLKENLKVVPLLFGLLFPSAAKAVDSNQISSYLKKFPSVVSAKLKSTGSKKTPIRSFEIQTVDQKVKGYLNEKEYKFLRSMPIEVFKDIVDKERNKYEDDDSFIADLPKILTNLKKLNFNIERDLELVREAVVEKSKTEEGRKELKDLYKKCCKITGDLGIMEGAFATTARNLEEKDGMDLGDYLEGRLLIVNFMISYKNIELRELVLNTLVSNKELMQATSDQISQSQTNPENKKEDNEDDEYPYLDL